MALLFLLKSSLPTLQCNALEDFFSVLKCSPSIHFLTLYPTSSCLSFHSHHSDLVIDPPSCQACPSYLRTFIFCFLWLEFSPGCDAGNTFSSSVIQFYNTNQAIFEHTLPSSSWAFPTAYPSYRFAAECLSQSFLPNIYFSMTGQCI